ncbi:MAG TPA: TlpA disulfide reductase family protein [Verrucomicrobiae bacterium]|nr:TlpA disulfide reductase family protein [Verrucomicrobiae bacterium]
MKLILSFFLVLAVVVTSARSADFSQFKTADELWQQVQDGERNVPRATRGQLRERLVNLHEAAAEFEKRYGTDPRRWDAKLIQLRADSTLADLDNKAPDLAAIAAGVKEIVGAPDATANVKSTATFFALGTRIGALDMPGVSTNAAALAAIEADIVAVRKNYPDDLRTALVQLDWADFLNTHDSEKAEALYRELAGHVDQRVSNQAKQELEKIQFKRELMKKPLDLKFTAVDGTDVDLAKLRGKVVLVDFWATWCVPCRMEVPNVVATYNRLQKDGFEVVGISLDRDKQQLLDFTKKSGMKWPQYFDGKMWDNELGRRFGVHAIPAAWLVDKKGFVRSLEARGDDLGEQVKKLLAE